MTRVDIPNFIETGRPDAHRPSLVFLHGIGGRGHSWQPVTEPLAAKGWHCLSWDMPGYGDSTSLSPCTFTGLAQALNAMLSFARVSRAVVIGHSLGGMVAQQHWAEGYRDTVGMVLVATSAAFGNGTGEFQQAFLQQRLAPIRRGESLLNIAHQLVPTLLSPSASQACADAAIRAMGSISSEAYQAALEALVTFDQRQALPSINVPCLCVAGELDQTAPPKVMVRMADKIPDSDYVCLPGLNHLLTFEQPDAFASIVLNFLERHWTYE